MHIPRIAAIKFPARGNSASNHNKPLFKNLTFVLRRLSIAVSTILALSATSLPAFADDTEIYFGQVPDDDSVRTNVLFILDNSLSMRRTDTGQSGRRIERMKDAMNQILDTSMNLNFSLMTLNGDHGGGPVRYPATHVDEIACVGNECASVTLNATISNSDDDIEEDISSGEPDTEVIHLSLGQNDSSAQLTGLRFRELNIPQGATITSAFLEVTASENSANGASFTIHAEDVDDSLPFNSGTNDLSNRNKTQASVTWAVFDAWQEDEVYESPNLAMLINEVIGKDQWCGGNSLSLVINGTGGSERTIKSVESTLEEASVDIEDDDITSITVAPNLRITYETALIPAGGACESRTAAGQVVNSSDDAQQRDRNGRVWLKLANSTTPANGVSTHFTNGLRFDDMSIPQGAAIDEAYISFSVAQGNDDDVSIKITGEATDNAQTFTNQNSGISNRTRTAASVIWTDLPVAATNTRIQTENLAPIVEEIVGREGWSNGNALAFVLENATNDLTQKRVFKTVDSGSANAPTLIVTYQTGQSTSSYTATARQEMKNIVDGLDLELTWGTPLLSAYYEAAQYMLGGPVTYADTRGKDPSYRHRRGIRSPAMRVSHPDSYTGGTLFTPERCTTSDYSNVNCLEERILHDGPGGPAIYDSPMTQTCQGSHIVILTDGLGTVDDGRHAIQSFLGQTSCDSNSNTEGCGTDLARWLSTTDHNPSIDGIQNIQTHTIAFNLSNASFLNDVATEGMGEFNSAESSADLVSALQNILGGVAASEASFAAPAVTVNQFNRLTHRDDIYFSLFQPDDSARWPGNLKRFRVASQSGSSDGAQILDAEGNPAIDPDTGFFSSDANSFWTEPDGNGGLVTSADGAIVNRGGAATRIGEAGIEARKLYTYLGDNAAIGNGVDLTDAAQRLHEDNDLLSDELLGIQLTHPDDPAQQFAYRQQLVQWIRGVDTLDEDGDDNESESRRHMGDPMHSQPALVNYRDGNDRDSSVVYVTTNEGLLHAIDTETGDELWAFSPVELLPNHLTFFDNEPGQSHPYGLDGPLSLWRDDPNNNLVVDANDNNEKALLITSMRRGGNNYYALDVTDPDTPKLAWVIEGGENGTAGFEELGESWSQATPAKILLNNAVQDVLIFGAGYDNNQDPDTTTQIMSQAGDAQGRGLFIVEAETGELLWSALGANGMASKSQIFTDMLYGMPGNIRVVDINSDGIADQLYSADMGGQVWRFDFTRTANNLLKGGVIANLSGLADADQRRFYTQPDVALIARDGERFLSISIGSGWRAHPLDTVVQDRFHVLKSTAIRSAPEGYGKQNAVGSWVPVTAADLRNSSDQTDTSSNPYGWYLDLPDTGEKVLTNALTFDNVVYFTSYAPDSSVELCGTGVGGGFAYALDIFNGSAIKDLNGDGDLDERSLTDKRTRLRNFGIPAAPGVLLPEDGTEPILLVGTEKVEVPLTNKTTRTFWVDTGSID